MESRRLEMSGWRRHKNTKAYKSIPKVRCKGRGSRGRRCRRLGRDVYINLKRGAGRYCKNCTMRMVTTGTIPN